MPVADNIPGGDAPKFRNLWETIGKRMPKKGRGSGGKSPDPLSLPIELLTALDALYGHYAKTVDAWREANIAVPPVFIVVCNNTSTSELVYKYISGFIRENDDGTTRLVNGRLRLFRNYDEHGAHIPVRTRSSSIAPSSNPVRRSTRISASWQKPRSPSSSARSSSAPATRPQATGSTMRPLGLVVRYLIGSTQRRYLPDFIVQVDDGRPDALNLVVEIKGFRGENAKDKANAMRAYSPARRSSMCGSRPWHRLSATWRARGGQQ